MGPRVGSQLEWDQVGLGQDADQLAGVHHRHGADGRVTRSLATSLSGMSGGTVTTGLDMTSGPARRLLASVTASLTRGPACA